MPSLVMPPVPDAAPAPESLGSVLRGRAQRRLPWPLPALLGWALAWGAVLIAHRLDWPPALALALAVTVPLPLAATATGPWRRVLVLAGFPVSVALVGGLPGWPAWSWLLLMLPLLALYPLRAWRDAPFFPSPPDALRGLPDRVALPAAPRLLDAGCGAGHGLVALHRAWPQARCVGVEWSWPLAMVARLRCRAFRARVWRGDLWAGDWSGFDLVYLFQRPESMTRAWDKARAEMRPGSWLVSLEFTVPEVAPDFTLHRPGARPVHAWRIGAPADAQPRPSDADIPRRQPPRRRGAA